LRANYIKSMQQDTPKSLNILVTGGSGFLGQAIVRELLDPTSPIRPEKILIFDINDPKIDGVDPRIEYFKGDVRDRKSLSEATKGMDLVIHSAAIIDWGTITEEEIYAVNTGGTQGKRRPLPGLYQQPGCSLQRQTAGERRRKRTLPGEAPDILLPQQGPLGTDHHQGNR
jgi:hypothetical protein